MPFARPGQISCFYGVHTFVERPLTTMLRTSLLLALCTALIPTGCNGARILVLTPYNARSHYVVMEPLLLALHAKGHHLTVVSSYKQKTPLPNYREIEFSRELPLIISNVSVASIKDTMSNFFYTAVYIFELHTRACDIVMRDERVLDLLNEEFDLVIGEVFGSDCANYFAHKLKAPLISWETSTAQPWLSDRAGLPDNPAYIPTYFGDFSSKMNLLERLFNTITLVYAKAVYYFYSDIPTRKMMEGILKESLPPLEEVNRMTSLILVNSHFSLNHARPFPPQVVEVGGIHIKETQPLPKDLQDILDNSRDGVILFSLGSIVRVASLPPSTIRMFLDAFATRPQKVIFKFEEDLLDVPPNVIVRRWLPQTDIIAHHNVRAVITHCGLASTIEAVHHAKPVIGLPFFSDQFQNAMNVVRRGGGVMLDYDNISRRDISEALRAVIEDPSYAEKMKRLSLQFRDRPMTPLQTAVYWTEYVIRHQGAPHLRPASVGMPFYQYLLLDVVAVLLISLAAVLYTVYFIIATLYSLVCGSRKEQIAKKRKKIN